MGTWQHGWAPLLSLVRPTLMYLPPLSQAVAKKWVTRVGETLGSLGALGAGET